MCTPMSDTDHDLPSSASATDDTDADMNSNGDLHDDSLPPELENPNSEDSSEEIEDASSHCRSIPRQLSRSLLRDADGINRNNRIWQVPEGDPHTHSLGPEPDEFDYSSHMLFMVRPGLRHGSQVVLGMPVPLLMANVTGLRHSSDEQQPMFLPLHAQQLGSVLAPGGRGISRNSLQAGPMLLQEGLQPGSSSEVYEIDDAPRAAVYCRPAGSQCATPQHDGSAVTGWPVSLVSASRGSGATANEQTSGMFMDSNLGQAFAAMRRSQVMQDGNSSHPTARRILHARNRPRVRLASNGTASSSITTPQINALGLILNTCSTAPGTHRSATAATAATAATGTQATISTGQTTAGASGLAARKLEKSGAQGVVAIFASSSSSSNSNTGRNACGVLWWPLWQLLLAALHLVQQLIGWHSPLPALQAVISATATSHSITTASGSQQQVLASADASHASFNVFGIADGGAPALSINFTGSTSNSSSTARHGNSQRQRMQQRRAAVAAQRGQQQQNSARTFNAPSNSTGAVGSASAGLSNGWPASSPTVSTVTSGLTASSTSSSGQHTAAITSSDPAGINCIFASSGVPATGPDSGSTGSSVSSGSRQPAQQRRAGHTACVDNGIMPVDAAFALVAAIAAAAARQSPSGQANAGQLPLRNIAASALMGDSRSTSRRQQPAAASAAAEASIADNDGPPSLSDGIGGKDDVDSVDRVPALSKSTLDASDIDGDNDACPPPFYTHGFSKSDVSDDSDGRDSSQNQLLSLHDAPTMDGGNLTYPLQSSTGGQLAPMHTGRDAQPQPLHSGSGGQPASLHSSSSSRQPQRSRGHVDLTGSESDPDMLSLVSHHSDDEASPGLTSDDEELMQQLHFVLSSHVDRQQGPPGLGSGNYGGSNAEAALLHSEYEQSESYKPTPLDAVDPVHSDGDSSGPPPLSSDADGSHGDSDNKESTDEECPLLEDGFTEQLPFKHVVSINNGLPPPLLFDADSDAAGRSSSRHSSSQAPAGLAAGFLNRGNSSIGGAQREVAAVATMSGFAAAGNSSRRAGAGNTCSSSQHFSGSGRGCLGQPLTLNNMSLANQQQQQQGDAGNTCSSSQHFSGSGRGCLGQPLTLNNMSLANQQQQQQGDAGNTCSSSQHFSGSGRGCLGQPLTLNNMSLANQQQQQQGDAGAAGPGQLPLLVGSVNLTRYLHQLLVFGDSEDNEDDSELGSGRGSWETASDTDLAAAGAAMAPAAATTDRETREQHLGDSSRSAAGCSVQLVGGAPALPPLPPLPFTRPRSNAFVVPGSSSTTADISSNRASTSSSTGSVDTGAAPAPAAPSLRLLPIGHSCSGILTASSSSARVHIPAAASGAGSSASSSLAVTFGVVGGESFSHCNSSYTLCKGIPPLRQPSSERPGVAGGISISAAAAAGGAVGSNNAGASGSEPQVPSNLLSPAAAQQQVAKLQQLVADKQYTKQLLQGLPGVDPSNASIQSALKQLRTKKYVHMQSAAVLTWDLPQVVPYEQTMFTVNAQRAQMLLQRHQVM